MNEDDSPEELEQYKVNKEEMAKMFCPECDEMAEYTVNIGDGPSYRCPNGHQWSPEDIDNCVECGKPLGGSDVICHSCSTENDTEMYML